MTIDPQARYLSSHEWARPEGELYVCGISDHAQDALGDVVYVDLPPVGSVFARGAVFGVVESVKAANDLYAPLSGEVVEVNEAVNQHPEQVNKDPYGAGWMVKIRASAPGEWDSLLDAKAYGELS
jgi:glycine cleavage system H protein